MKNIAIFASGSGSNAENISNYFKDNNHVKVALILTNNPQAGVLARAGKLDIDSVIIDRAQFKDAAYVLGILQQYHIDLIVLAGFLWLIPPYLIEQYEHRIVNIHPALLPKYGGQGMYGDKVHQAVKSANDVESGITIHYVNEHYDKGDIIFQTRCALELTDSPADIAQKVHQLEYAYYPQVVDELLQKL